MANLRSSLISLPEEIFAQVLLDISQASYLDLNRACQSLYHRVTPYLYHSVYFRGHKDRHYDEDYHFQRPRQTKIFSIDCFYRTMQSSPILVSFLQVVSFVLSRDIDDTGLESTDKLVLIVNLMDHAIKSLHLEASRWPIPFYSQVSILVTNLEIMATNLRPNDGNSGVDRRKLYALFILPRLQSLTVHGICSWEEFPADDNTREMYRCSSEITSLAFISCTYPGKEIIEVLTWPKALKSFRFEPADYRSHVNLPIDPSSFTDALKSQRESLEELYVFREISYLFGMIHDKPVDLKPFPMLKRVGLPRNHLVTAKRVSCLKEPAHIYESLPPSLEELQIEISERNSWSSYFRGTKDEMEESPGETSMWLGDIAKMKASLYPKLRRVLLYHDWDKVPASYQFEVSADSKDFIEGYTKANIRLSHETEIEDTLFEDEPASVSRRCFE